MEDPAFIHSADWGELGQMLTYLAIYLGLAVTCAGSFLLAHAIIPSLIYTGHIPPKLHGQVQKLRSLLYFTSIAAIGLAVALMFVVADVAQVLGRLWDRWWI